MNQKTEGKFLVVSKLHRQIVRSQVNGHRVRSKIYILVRSKFLVVSEVVSEVN